MHYFILKDTNNLIITNNKNKQTHKTPKKNHITEKKRYTTHQTLLIHWNPNIIWHKYAQTKQQKERNTDQTATISTSENAFRKEY